MNSKNGSHTPSGKQKKIFFQAKDPREKDAWVNSLEEAIKKANEVEADDFTSGLNNAKSKK